MGSLGFRPPQFSEELAWLPACLQRITDTSVEPRSPSHQQFKELSCIQREDLELSGKESQVHRFQLFLSEDNSPISPLPSSEDVLHFRLHLSSDGDSPYYQSQLLGAACAQHGSDKVLQLPQVETLAGSGVTTGQIKTKNFTDVVHASPPDFIPRAVENVGSKSLNDIKGCSQCSVKKDIVRNLIGTDIKDAVELSIAASEALVIHELVKSEPSFEALSTPAVIEAALQVKQARLESLEVAFDSLSEKSDEVDFLSDLDDFTMADAFQDVGLSFSGVDDQHACGSDVSLVKDTPVYENCFRSESRSKTADHFSTLNLPNGPIFELNNSGFTSNFAPNMQNMAQETLHGSATAQRVGFSTVDASVQPLADLNCSDSRTLENAAGETNANPSVADTFRSRWFGGWTGKEEADLVQMRPKTKNIPKCFAAETSFFSESADVAPDENSFVMKCEKNRYKIASDQSVLFEGLCNQVDEDIIVSQYVRSSNLSFVDPLCSIVPCSISSANVGSTLGQNGSSGEAKAGNCFGSAAELENENLHVESTYRTRKTSLTFSNEYAAAKVQRQLSSLKAYSTVLHEHDSILRSERLCLNQSTSLNLGDSRDIRLSDKRNSETSLDVNRIPASTIGGDTEKNKHSTPVNNPDGEATNYKQNSSEHDNEGNELQNHVSKGDELQNHASKGESSPLILPKRISQRMQAARLLVRSAPTKANAAQETSVELKSVGNLQLIKSKDNNHSNVQVPSRKRVHFSEIEVNIQENKGLQKRPCLRQKCSASRSSKRFNSDAEIRESKRINAIRFRKQQSLVFQDIKFLVTGFSSEKKKEIEGLVRRYGGIVLVDIPSPSNRGKRRSRHKFQQLPILLCPKKLETTKFLYACAVNSLILKVKWLTDSIAAGSALSPGKYMVLSKQPDARFIRIRKPVHHDTNTYIFDGVGIMLHGKEHFCTKFAKAIQHGGGRVFKTLLWLVQNLDTEKISLAVIVTEDENGASRHLRQCASERNIPLMPGSWILRSLYSGRLLPFIEKKDTTSSMDPDFTLSDDWSQEI